MLGALESEPPLNLDIDDVIASARKETSRKRALVATAAATVVLVGAIIVVPTTAKAMDDVQAMTFPGPSSTTSVASPTTPTYRPAQIAERSAALAAALPARIAAAIPGATNIVTRAGVAPDLLGFVGIAQFTTFTLNGAQHGIHFTVIATGAEDLSDCVGAETECRSGGMGVGGRFRLSRSVDVVRPDLSVVTAQWHAGESGAPSAEVIDGYLTALANDPALHF
ncbi:hypothetical protein [Actinokineospora alba]|uniref:hypothetical protein n=1 Tax=Actinokineospora alba TaxID=504798 RepID=UPI0010608CC3|nr:hypothetical protein [Actinokineospora alba]